MSLRIFLQKMIEVASGQARALKGLSMSHCGQGQNATFKVSCVASSPSRLVLQLRLWDPQDCATSFGDSGIAASDLKAPASQRPCFATVTQGAPPLSASVSCPLPRPTLSLETRLCLKYIYTYIFYSRETINLILK